MKFLIIAGHAESLLNFRGPLIDAILESGFMVHAVAPFSDRDSGIRQKLEAKGVNVHDVPMQRAGMNPLADIATLYHLWRVIRLHKPGYVMGYTIKPVIYGSLAAWLCGVQGRFALITGLGYAFQGGANERKLLKWVVQHLYRFVLSKTEKVFFQNSDDLELFSALGILCDKTTAVVVNGSGVDVTSFDIAPLPQQPNFLLIARLLGDKGVREYVQAAVFIKKIYPDTVFSLVGWIDENPDAITQRELEQWIEDGVITFHGRLSDVRPAIADCSVYVLPSYREGTPRTVLEAMAMGRPIITTDAPGCRETVTDGDNGFLVPVKAVDELAVAMIRFIEQPSLVASMGARSRQIAEEKYDVHKVNTFMLNEMGIK
jgi:glycosyltransferase involved in cell wall biosynthesis